MLLSSREALRPPPGPTCGVISGAKGCTGLPRACCSHACSGKPWLGDHGRLFIPGKHFVIKTQYCEVLERKFRGFSNRENRPQNFTKTKKQAKHFRFIGSRSAHHPRGCTDSGMWGVKGVRRRPLLASPQTCHQTGRHCGGTGTSRMPASVTVVTCRA